MFARSMLVPVAGVLILCAVRRLFGFEPLSLTTLCVCSVGGTLAVIVRQTLAEKP